MNKILLATTAIVFVAIFILLGFTDIGYDLAALKLQPKETADGKLSAGDMTALGTLSLLVNGVLSLLLTGLAWTAKGIHWLAEKTTGKPAEEDEEDEEDGISAQEDVLIMAVKRKDAVAVKALCNMIAGEEFLK